MREEDVGSEIRLAVAKPRDEGRVGLEVELEAEDEGLGGDVVKGAEVGAVGEGGAGGEVGHVDWQLFV